MVVMSRANSAKADYGSSYLLLAVLIAVLGGVNPYGGYGKVIGVVLAVLTMQFLSSGLNMLGVSNFARELIWGALLIFVMIVNTPLRLSPAQAQACAVIPEPELADEEDPQQPRRLCGRDAGGPDRRASANSTACTATRAVSWRGPRPGAPGKVGIVTGGGSGHLPVFTGYVGTGLLDACAIGDVFASPSAEQMADAIRAADQRGRGAAALRQLRRRRDELRHGGRPGRVRGHPLHHGAAGR